MKRPDLLLPVLACLLIGLLVPAAVRAQTSCTVTTAPPMMFGNYNPLSATALDAQTSMTVRCAGSGIAVVRVRIGPGLSGTVGARTLERNGVGLSYGLYITGSRSIKWGDGTDGTIPNLRILAGNAEVVMQMFGRIPARQNIPAGLYSDSVILQLDW